MKFWKESQVYTGDFCYDFPRETSGLIWCVAILKFHHITTHTLTVLHHSSVRIVGNLDSILLVLERSTNGGCVGKSGIIPRWMVCEDIVSGNQLLMRCPYHLHMCRPAHPSMSTSTCGRDVQLSKTRVRRAGGMMKTHTHTHRANTLLVQW